MYSYTLKAYIVCCWREERGEGPFAKWGKAICKNKLINSFENKSYQKFSCGTVYYD